MRTSLLVLSIAIALPVLGCGGPRRPEAHSGRGAVSASDPSVQAAASERLREFRAKRDAIARRLYGDRYDYLSHEQRMRVDEERRASSGDRKAQPVSARDLVGRLEAILTLYDFRNRAVLSGDVPASEQWVSMMNLAGRTAKLRDEAEAEAERTRSLRLQKLAEAAGHAYAAIADTALLMHDYPDGGTTAKVDPIASRIVDELNRTTECLNAARLAGDTKIEAGEAPPDAVLTNPFLNGADSPEPQQFVEHPPQFVLKGTISGQSPLAVLAPQWSYDGGSINMGVGDKCEGADGQTWVLVAIKEQSVTFRSPRGTKRSIGIGED